MHDDMTHDDMMNQEPLGPAEPALRSALHSAYGSVPEQVDWDAMAARIGDAAVFRLAQRRPRGGWQHTAARWSGRAVPMAAAASVMLALGLALAPGSPGTDSLLASDTVMLEEVMAVAASDGLPTDLALASAQDEFLAVMLNGED
jgi:hypothetical protein